MDVIKNTESMPEMVEFELLTKEWQRKKLAVIEAENELDAQTIAYLENKGARPKPDALENVSECRHQEYEARGQLDHFIAELP